MIFPHFSHLFFILFVMFTSTSMRISSAFTALAIAVTLFLFDLASAQKVPDFKAPTFGERFGLCEACYASANRIQKCQSRFVRCVRVWKDPNLSAKFPSSLITSSLSPSARQDAKLSRKIKRITIPRDKNIFGSNIRIAVLIFPPSSSPSSSTSL